MNFSGEKQVTGRFQKGQSGNPAGKPKGAKDKRTELRSLFEPHRAKLIKKAVTMALAGDTTALRICLDRLVAPVRSNPVRIDGFTGTLAERGEAVVAAIASASISAEEGAALMTMLQAQARIVEATELEKRLSALEKALANGGKHGSA
ncbi:MAG: hypothetical protein A3K04_09680 [Gallionellales bacterium RBG_16_56_9]|nr:MAG: hypothetical protein A3K04_09680 [Gallionellales bacterium RBG_16_56_9]